MADFEDALQGLNPELVIDVVFNVGAGDGSPENDKVEKLMRYPGFAALIASLGERLDGNPKIDPDQRQLIMLGAATCMEVLADYAAAEALGNIVDGGFPDSPPYDFPQGIQL